MHLHSIGKIQWIYISCMRCDSSKKRRWKNTCIMCNSAYESSGFRALSIRKEPNELILAYDLEMKKKKPHKAYENRLSEIANAKQDKINAKEEIVCIISISIICIPEEYAWIGNKAKSHLHTSCSAKHLQCACYSDCILDLKRFQCWSKLIIIILQWQQHHQVLLVLIPIVNASARYCLSLDMFISQQLKMQIPFESGDLALSIVSFRVSRHFWVSYAIIYERMHNIL